MSSRSLVLFLQALALAGTFLTVWKLLRTHLHHRYQAFFWYFCFRIIDSLPAFFFDVKSFAYFYCWVYGTPITWIFYVLVVRELYGLVLERHKGMYTLGRWIMYVGVILSVTLSILSFLPRIPKAAAQRSQWQIFKNSIVGYLLAVDRGITFALAIFLILMVVLLGFYAVTLSRNVRVHTSLFACLFLSSSIAALLHSVFGVRVYTSVDTGLMAIASICTFAWFFLLSPHGEEVPKPAATLGPQEESRILYQLDALNTTLLRVARK